ncbi:MAG: ABC transporter permease, partial [Acidimicrobiia bacterium]
EFRQARDTTELEARGLWLFALAVLIGGGTLVGQALVRAVTARAGDLETLQAMGAADHTLATGLVLPAVVTAVVAAVVTFGLAVALSARFPIGVARRYDLDPGVHVDWTVLGPAGLAAFVAVVAVAAVVAFWRIARGEARAVRPSAIGRWATRSGAPPVIAIGSRLALEPGRGRRAVPVRSAIIGAIAGVMGVVACFTFRAGVDDAVSRPQRSGIVWNAMVGDVGSLPDATVAALVRQPEVEEATRARWLRSIVVDGESVPGWSVAQSKGDMQWVVLDGRAPRGTNEIAFGPSTLELLGIAVGDTVRVGPERVPMVVVGEALLPWSPHSAYTDGAWIDRTALPNARGKVPPREGFDFVLMEVTPGTDWRTLAANTGIEGLELGPPEYAPDVLALGKLRTLPLVLGVFLALLAVATLAHALVTTVNRRRGELAVLRTLGFGRRQSRLAIAWQATLLAVIGVAIGVPLGIAFGRMVWRSLAENFPLVYSPPTALLATLLVIPVALLVANLVAAGPSRRAARIQPAAVLRSE